MSTIQPNSSSLRFYKIWYFDNLNEDLYPQ
uniref:Uncharacterized protein n=1 Tax=Arundo donax TaxID=35708 RepID=A0A0A9BCT6_ARUDO